MAPSAVAIATPQRWAPGPGAPPARAGGTAIDAALAAAFELTVSYPNNCALGGDAIVLFKPADGPPVVINASGPAAAAVDVAAWRAGGAGMPVYGPHAVTVPGLVAGLHELWSRGARRPWAGAFEAAIEHAEAGIEVVPTLAKALRGDVERLRSDPGIAAV